MGAIERRSKKKKSPREKWRQETLVPFRYLPLKAVYINILHHFILWVSIFDTFKNKFKFRNEVVSSKSKLSLHATDPYASAVKRQLLTAFLWLSRFPLPLLRWEVCPALDLEFLVMLDSNLLRTSEDPINPSLTCRWKKKKKPFWFIN